MALVKYGAGVMDMSGSLEGTTFSRNRFGSYARAKAMPVNPNTARQNTVRGLMADLTQQWTSVLTPVQRENWNNYAAAITVKNRLGDDVYLTGLNHYVRSNVARMQAGLARVDDGPAILTLPGEDTTITAGADSGSQELTVTFDDSLDWVSETGGAMLIRVGQPQGTGINFFAGPFRFADSIDGDDSSPPSTPATVASPWTIQANHKLFIEARIARADGRLSNPFRPQPVIST